MIILTVNINYIVNKLYYIALLHYIFYADLN